MSSPEVRTNEYQESESDKNKSHHKDSTNNERQKSNNEGSNRAESHRLRGHVGDDAGEDGDHPVPESCDREGDADPLRGEPVPLGVLVHIPLGYTLVFVFILSS